MKNFNMYFETNIRAEMVHTKHIYTDNLSTLKKHKIFCKYVHYGITFLLHHTCLHLL
jgi:hypothetical protein